MKLIRFAAVHLKLKPAGQEPLRFQTGNISIDVQEVTSADASAHRLLLRAGISLAALPDVSPSGEVTVPKQPRKDTETAIEELANVLAVLNHSSRRISSPAPRVALHRENEEEKNWAAGLSHFIGNHAGIPRTFYRLPPSPENLEALSDRMHGTRPISSILPRLRITVVRLAARYLGLVAYSDAAVRKCNQRPGAA